MQTHRTFLAALTAVLLSAAPLWARGGGGGGLGGGGSVGGVFNGTLSRGGVDSKGSDGGSTRGSGGSGSGKGAGGGGSSKGSGGGNSSKGGGNSGPKEDRSERERDNGGKARDDDRKSWPNDREARRGGNGRGNHQPPCPRGHRNCHRRCCNRYGYGFGYPYWGLSGYGWSDPYYNGADYDRDEQRERKGYGQGNVELKLSPKEVEVYVNGILYSTKGTAKISLPTGKWTLEIRAEGYLTETLELDIEQGVKYKVERKLQRDPDYRRPERDERRSDA